MADAPPQTPQQAPPPQPTTVVGRQTFFGTNPDGSPDTGDKPNSGFFTNPQTNSPYDSHSQQFASVPFSVFRASVGNPYDPKIQQAVSNGAYHVRATINGVTKDLPLGDLGPAAWTGNALDITGSAAPLFGAKDNSKAAYQIIGPDNKPVAFDTSKIGIDPNAPIEQGKSRSTYSDATLQRYMQTFAKSAPGLKIMLPEEVARTDNFVANGGNLDDIDPSDRLAYHIAKDPTFLLKPENIGAFTEQIWNKQPKTLADNLVATANSIPGMVQGLWNLPGTIGQLAQSSASNRAATAAQAIGQGSADAIDFLDSATQNISNLPKSIAAGLSGNPQVNAKVDAQNASDAQALMLRSYQRSQWQNDTQNAAANLFTAVGQGQFGDAVKNATPDPKAVQAESFITNPINLLPEAAGIASQVVKPMMFERAIDASVAAAKADAASTAVNTIMRGVTGQATADAAPIVRASNSIASTAISDSDRINSALASNIQNSPILASAAQGLGNLTQGVGNVAKLVNSLPEYLLNKATGGNAIGEAAAGAAIEHFLPHVIPLAIASKVAESAVPAGKLLALAGKEGSYAETSIPFFQRMAQQTQGLTRGVMQALDNPAVYTAISATKGAVSGAATGAMMGSVGNPVPSLATAFGGAAMGSVFGAVGGGLGQWQKYSSPGQFMMEAAGDLKRYKDTATSTELQGFNRLAPTDQGKLATAVQHFPGLQLEFQHDPTGPAGFHEITPEGRSRVMINTASATPLDGVIAHELMHATVHDGNLSSIQDSILGNPDKGIAPQYSPQEFAAMKQQYIDKLASSNRPTSHLNDKDIALELYAEHGVNYLKSGQSFVDAKSAFNPAVSANPGAMKNAMSKLGYAFDENGNNVRGTNLFQNSTDNSKLDQLQKKYFQEKQKYDLSHSEDPVDKVITQEDLKRSPGLAAQLKAVPRDGNGVPLRPNTAAADRPYLKLSGDIKKQIAALPQDLRDQMGHYKEGNGTEHFNYLPDSVIENLRKSGHYNSVQLDNLEKINNLRKDPAQHGAEIKTFYQAVYKNGQAGSIAGADRFWTPQGFKITTKGNMNIKMADFGKLVNAYAKIKNRPEVKAAGFTGENDFARTAQQYFENHQNNLPGSTGLDLHPGIAEIKKNAINASLGLDTQAWKDSNPLARQLPRRTGSFIVDPRLDRMNNVQLSGVMQPKVNYDSLNRNYHP